MLGSPKLTLTTFPLSFLTYTDRFFGPSGVLKGFPSWTLRPWYSADWDFFQDSGSGRSGSPRLAGLYFLPSFSFFLRMFSHSPGFASEISHSSDCPPQSSYSASAGQYQLSSVISSVKPCCRTSSVSDTYLYIFISCNICIVHYVCRNTHRRYLDKYSSRRMCQTVYIYD